MKNSYYSNGKLLLTGEYLVLDGTKSLAIPTKLGQDLVIQTIKEPELVWGSFTNENSCWFEARFSLPNIRLISSTFNSDKEGSSEFIAETLQKILLEAKKLNPDFLNIQNGLVIKTNLGFPRDWGLGSSSTLINNIASWAEVNPFSLLWNSFSGSGYDIACAKTNSPIFYTLKDKTPIIEEVNFQPSFSEELFFIHLNKKQNSRDGITQYKKNKTNLASEIKQVSELTNELTVIKNTTDFNKIIEIHEQIISSVIKQETIKKRLFSDYFGSIKSLGAWGGDFILATGNEDTKKYFNSKGFKTVLSYDEMV